MTQTHNNNECATGRNDMNVCAVWSIVHQYSNPLIIWTCWLAGRVSCQIRNTTPRDGGHSFCPCAERRGRPQTRVSQTWHQPDDPFPAPSSGAWVSAPHKHVTSTAGRLVWGSLVSIIWMLESNYSDFLLAIQFDSCHLTILTFFLE